MTESDSPATVLALRHLTEASARDGAYVRKEVSTVLEAACLPLSRGMRILVKPNLLLAQPLACTTPEVVAGVCSWLLEKGADVVVSDSPGFGSLRSVAASVGLTRVLAPLGVPLVPMGRTIWTKKEVLGRTVSLPIGERALQCDAIISVPRVKVHRQMGVSLSVKNCFGCIPGLHKAVIHTLYGGTREFFAAYVAELFCSLPRVYAVADGTLAMHVMGPSGGQPYPLNLLAACTDAPVLDMALMGILGIDWQTSLLADTLAKNIGKKQPSPSFSHVPQEGVLWVERQLREASYPLDRPEDWQVTDFVVPAPLMHTSFAPHRLLFSCLRRLYLQVFSRKIFSWRK